MWASAMSEIITRSDWLYEEPTNLSDADDVGADNSDHYEPPELHAAKVKQGGREYYEAAKDSERLQEVMAVYFNRTRDRSDLLQEVNEIIQKEDPDRYSRIKEADHYGLSFAAKALAEDGLLEAKVYESSPSEDNPHAKLINGVPHWECNTCNLVVRSISEDLINEGINPTICPVGDRPL